MQTVPNVRDLLTALFKYRHIGLVAFLATVATVSVETLRKPVVYEATSLLLVKTGREHAYLPEFGDSRIYVNRDREGIIKAEMKILKSRDLAQRLVDSEGAEAVYPSLVSAASSAEEARGAVVTRLLEEITVAGFEKTDVIRVSLQHRDPQLAADVVNELVEIFKEMHLEIFSKNDASAFLEEKVRAYEILLEQTEDELETFKIEHLTLSQDQQRELLLRRRQKLVGSLEETENLIAGLEHEIASLRQDLSTLSEEIPLYTETESLRNKARTQLLELELEEQKLLGTFKETDRRVQNVRKQIRLVERFLEEHDQNVQEKEVFGKNRVYQELERGLIVSKSELRSSRAQRSSLKVQLGEIEEELKYMAALEKKLRRLDRALSTQERNYETYADKLEESRLSDEMDRHGIASISVIQRASPPAKPKGPNRRLNLAIGLFFGALVGLTLPLLVDFLRQEVSTPSAVEKRLGLPVLVTIDRKELPGGGQRPLLLPPAPGHSR
jgi:uncharacterized protein involved in exopolysaccharide biosynthesis